MKEERGKRREERRDESEERAISFFTEVGKRARGRSEDCTEWRRDQGTPLGTLGRISERVGRILERLGRILAHLERILERLGRILGRIWGCQRDRKASIIEH